MWALANIPPWGVAGFGDDASIDDVSSKLATNRHGRAALGIAAEHIRAGYDVIDSIKPSLLDDMIEPRGMLARALGMDTSAAYADVRSQGRDLLDRTNTYAQGLYAQLPDDDAPLDSNMRGQINLALQQAASNLALLESVKDTLVQSFLADLEELMNAILTATKASLDFIASAAKKIATTVIPDWVFWTLGGVGLMVAGLYVAPLLKLAPRRKNPKRRR